jgi:hypothetical protein
MFKWKQSNKGFTKNGRPNQCTMAYLPAFNPVFEFTIKGDTGMCSHRAITLKNSYGISPGLSSFSARDRK